MQWDIQEKSEVLKTVPFTVEKLTLFDRHRQMVTHPYHRLTCPDWVNVLAVTPTMEAVLVRQSRAGTLSDTLEVPGGMIDRHEKDPTMAALRELEEETGYTARTILPLGSINPNPAIMANTLHMFVALQATPQERRRHFPDEGERIEIVHVPVRELDQMVRLRRIDSALAALTIMLAGKYVTITQTV